MLPPQSGSENTVVGADIQIGRVEPMLSSRDPYYIEYGALILPLPRFQIKDEDRPFNADAAPRMILGRCASPGQFPLCYGQLVP